MSLTRRQKLDVACYSFALKLICSVFWDKYNNSRDILAIQQSKKQLNSLCQKLYYPQVKGSFPQSSNDWTQKEYKRLEAYYKATLNDPAICDLDNMTEKLRFFISPLNRDMQIYLFEKNSLQNTFNEFFLGFQSIQSWNYDEPTVDMPTVAQLIENFEPPTNLIQIVLKNNNEQTEFLLDYVKRIRSLNNREDNTYNVDGNKVIKYLMD